MIHILLSPEIIQACPDLHILTISCNVTNSASNEKLWEKIHALEKELQQTLKTEDINKLEKIRATRQVYKKLGKDPNRYRPSSEALLRRIIKGYGLYQVDTLVDLINYVSMLSGYSIGGFDAEKIEGDKVTLGVGRAGELYHGIGRGELNIEGLPVYRDNQGGIGTPTSDEERTKINPETQKLFMIINGYAGAAGLEESGRLAADLLKEYAGATSIELTLYTSTSCENIGL